MLKPKTIFDLLFACILIEFLVVFGIENPIGLGRVFGEHMARSPTPRGPAAASRPARRPPPRLGGRPDGVARGRPVAGRPGGTDAHAERPRAWAGRRGEAQRFWWAAAGRRVAPGPDGPRVEGGRRAAAWAVVVARGRRCARTWSITGHATTVPSGRKPPSVTSGCRCGCQ